MQKNTMVAIQIAFTTRNNGDPPRYIFTYFLCFVYVYLDTYMFVRIYDLEAFRPCESPV